MGAIPKHLMQHAFTTGEMAPATLARQDVQKYASGLQYLENFQVAPQGGIYNDTGTVFVADTKIDADKSRLIPFVFSNTQAYVVELGNLYARFYTNGGRIENPPGTPIEVVTPYAAADVQDIQFCQSADFLYLVHPAYPPSAITRTSNIAWNYTVLTFTDGPYQDANTDPTKTITASGLTGSVTLTANFNAWVAGNVGSVVRLGEAATTYYEQWAAQIVYPYGYLVTNDGNTYKCTSNQNIIPAWQATTAVTSGTAVIASGNIYLINTTGTTGSTAPSFTSPTTSTVGGISYSYLGTVNSIPDRPLGEWQAGVAYPIGYYVFWGENGYVSTVGGTSGTLPPTQTSGIVSDGGITWLFIGERSGTRAPIHITGTQSDGNLNWLYLDSGFGYAKITAYISPTQVTATVLSNQLPNSVTGGTLQFRLGAWDTANGYPSATCFYESRLVFAGSPGFPETIWMSNAGDYYNFAPTDTGTNVLDTNAINITLASGTINQIVWLLPVTRLLVGTIGSEWQVWAESTSSGFSPSNVQAKQMSSKGAVANVPCILVDLAAIYVHRSEKRLYEATYNYLYDLYVSKDLNLLAEHILREGLGVVTLCLQQDPYSVVWVLREDGVLVGLTEHEDEQISGWHRHVYQGTVESIACIPNPANNSDQLWMTINRTVNGQTVRYVEYMQQPFYPTSPTDKASMWYVECGTSFNNGTVVSTISGLGYLQGKTIVPVVDGAVQPTQVVPSSGSITLQTPGTNVVIGLPYTSTATIMPLDFEGQKGTMQAQTNIVRRVYTRILNSLGLTLFSGTAANPDRGGENNLVRSFRTTYGNMNQSPDFFTGDDAFDITCSEENPQGVFTIQQTQPYPLNVLGLITEVNGNER